jgi:hypothetical protein
MEIPLKTPECTICNSNDIVFESLLKDFPMGNIYLSMPEQGNQFLRDIKIFQCVCGHLSAKSDFPSDAIYNVDYSYSGDSVIPSMRRAHGLKMITKYLDDSSFNNLIDIGCGNFELIKQFMEELKITGQKIGIDPVPRESLRDDILFINAVFEDSNLDLISDSKIPNLFCLDNVLEHIENVNDFFEEFVKLIQLKDYVYVCVPSFEMMLKCRNFEEISHEHTQYFSLTAMNDLFSRFGFEELVSYSESIGTRGYNFHLFRNQGEGNLIRDKKRSISQDRRHWNRVSKSLPIEFEIFKDKLKGTLPSTFENTWGLCASEVTPVLCYFMGTSLEKLQGILDTTPAKAGKFMPGVSPRILPWENLDHIPKDSNLFITVPQLASIVKPKLIEQGFFNVVFAEK